MLNRCYKISNSWKGFDNDLENLTKILNKNQFPTKLINKVTKKYLNLKLNKRPLENNTEVNTDTRFFKLAYLGIYSNIAQRKIQNLVETFCQGIDVKVVLTPFKIRNKFSYKDPLTFHLQSFIVYKFICANCKVCYVGETTRHFITRINEHLQKDAKSSIFKYLQESSGCNSVCNKKWSTETIQRIEKEHGKHRRQRGNLGGSLGAHTTPFKNQVSFSAKVSLTAHDTQVRYHQLTN